MPRHRKRKAQADPREETWQRRQDRGDPDNAGRDRRTKPEEQMETDDGLEREPLDTRGGPGKDIGDEIDLWL